jgi:hypothetical protein
VTRRRRADAANTAREAAFAAADAHRQRFGKAPPTWDFMGRPAELARELRAAVARGEPATAEDLSGA